VALMTGCVQSVLRAGITTAAARVLATQGVEVVVPPAQGCCGALAAHCGDAARGERLVTAHQVAFPTDVDAIVATAAGCGSWMKEHAGRPPVVDVAEYLDGLGLHRPLRLAAPVTAVYQDACHLSHAQQVTAAPRRLLQQVEGLTLVALADADLCCGSAGLYNIEQPALAAELGARKAAAVVASGAGVAVTGNIGCLTQLEATLAAGGHRLPVRHTMELLVDAGHDASGRRAEAS
jgi:glycolate oxidase iron-sulfur subunit